MSDVKQIVFMARSGQLSQSNIMNSINLFASKLKQGMPAIGAIAKTEEIAPNGVIYKYKIGKINTNEFIIEMNSKFQGVKLDEQDFKECWNKMCEMSGDTIDNLKCLAKLQETHKFHLHIIAFSNPMHIEFIKSQLEQNDIPLKLTYTYSYVTSTLEKDKLIEAATRDLHSKFSENVSIINIIDQQQPLLEMITKHLSVQQLPAFLQSAYSLENQRDRENQQHAVNATTTTATWNTEIKQQQYQQKQMWL
jgi:hypothetical protein